MKRNWLYQGTEVLAFGDQVTVEPDLASFARTFPDRSLGSSLFLTGQSLYAVLQIAAGRDWRLLDLRTGVISPFAGSQMFSFSKWRLGIQFATGDAKWLVDVS